MSDTYKAMSVPVKSLGLFRKLVATANDHYFGPADEPKARDDSFMTSEHAKELSEIIIKEFDSIENENQLENITYKIQRLYSILNLSYPDRELLNPGLEALIKEKRRMFLSAAIIQFKVLGLDETLAVREKKETAKVSASPYITGSGGTGNSV